MTLPTLRESLRMAYLLPEHPDASPLPLEKTAVNAQILGPLATVTVTQHFTNQLTEPAELEYLMPLPQTAAIIAFELQIGARLIQGDLKETEQAQQAFARAREEGRRAGLLEARRPNLFSVQLTHVQPGEPILATLRYQERLSYDDGVYQFVFPLGLTPKFHSPSHPEESRKVDAPVASDWEPIGPVEISAQIDAGAPTGEPTSPSHALIVTRQDGRSFAIRLAAPARPDHDFVLRYPAAQAETALTAWCTPETDGKAVQDEPSRTDIFLATLVPPALEIDEAVPEPREFIFVLDRSGSMSGEPVAQARNALRACLRTLAPADQFRVLLFDDRLEWYRAEALPVNQAEIDAADGYLSQVEGRGGTEIVAALEAALSLPAETGRTRYVVFLTDGAVSSEDRALERLRRLAGPARIFTFGIGPSVNRALLQRMAQAGRGTAEFLQLNEDIEGAIIRFQDRVAFPLVTDLELACENGQVWDVYPARLPDLYLGQPLEIAGRVRRQGNTPLKMVARGRRSGQPVTMTAVLTPASAPLPAIIRAWARARLDDLLQQEELAGGQAHRLRSEIISLSLDYGLVTPYTSFVAADTVTTGAKREPRLVRVSQPLPAGLRPEGFFGPGMQRAAAQPPPHMPLSASMATTGAVSFDLTPGSKSQASDSPDWPPSSPTPATPTFLREERDVTPRKKMAAAGISSETGSIVTSQQAGEDPLHWLARTQQLDGSWRSSIQGHSPDQGQSPENDMADVELTSAALLAFLRRGHTTRSGNFRQQVHRATGWLADQPASGFAAFARAAVLAELASLTGAPAHRQAAESALAALPAPASRLETAARLHLTRGGPEPVEPGALRDLDDLRLAALLKVALPVPPALLQTSLGQTWAAALPA